MIIPGVFVEYVKIQEILLDPVFVCTINGHLSNSRFGSHMTIFNSLVRYIYWFSNNTVNW